MKNNSFGVKFFFIAFKPVQTLQTAKVLAKQLNATHIGIN